MAAAINGHLQWQSVVALRPGA